MGGIDLYQQTKEEREGQERRQGGSPEPAGTRHKRSSNCVHGTPEGGGGGGGKKGRKGNGRAVARQVAAQSQLTSSTRRLTEGAGEGARGAIRYDALDTIPTREEGTLGLWPHSAAHTTTWMPIHSLGWTRYAGIWQIPQVGIDDMPCLPACPARFLLAR